MLKTIDSQSLSQIQGGVRADASFPGCYSRPERPTLPTLPRVPSPTFPRIPRPVL
jgi:hypothetical protein